MKSKLRFIVKAILILPFLALVITTSFSQPVKTGIIKGKVKAADGQAVEGVSVMIQGTGKGAVTNEDGMFEIKKAPVGYHVLVVSLVGHQAKTVNVEVTANNISTADVALAESSEALQEVIIQARGRGYLNNKPSSSLRIQTPVLETPQSIISITSGVISDQQLYTTTDVAKNVSGVTTIFPYVGVYTDFSIRGTRANANSLRNGMQLSNSLQEDMSYVDNIEFIKGPAGFMLSQGEPGGMYNVVTKKPLKKNHGAVSISTGSYGLFRTTADVGGPLGEKFFYRLNIAGQKSGTHLNYGQNNRISVAPVIRYEFDEKTALTVEYNGDFATANGTFNYVPTIGQQTKLPRSFMLDDPGVTPGKYTNHYGYVNLQHQLNTSWKLTAQVGVSYYSEANRTFYSSGNFDTLGRLLRYYRPLFRDYRVGNAQVFVNGDVNTGNINHKLLIGYDGGQRETKSKLKDIPNIPIDIYNPVYGIAAMIDTIFDESTMSWSPATVIRWQAFSATDNIKLSNWLQVTVGARFTSFMSGTEQRTDNVFTPRAGLLLQPFPNTSFYAMYDQSFLPQTALSFNKERFEPLTGNNMEVGMKREWVNNRLFTQVAVYKITKNNVLTADPDHPGFSIQRGQVVSKGVEVDVMGAVSRNFSVVTNYAYTDAKVTKDTNPLVVGTRQLTPLHVFNGWLRYAAVAGPVEGLGAALGFSSWTGRYTGTTKKVAADPQRQLPDYTNISAALYYKTGNINLAFNIDNIRDSYNYIGNFDGRLGTSGEFMYISMPGRNYRVSVAYKF